jgi:hypothetical protein
MEGGDASIVFDAIGENKRFPWHPVVDIATAKRTKQKQ